MGLNMNYSLLLEGSPTYQIPNYNTMNNSFMFQESYITETFTMFSQEIREAKMILMDICESDVVNEASVVGVINVICGVCEKVSRAINDIKERIKKFVREIIRRIKVSAQKFNHRKDKLPKLIANYIDITSKMDSLPTVDICDISLTPELEDDNFPNIDPIKKCFVRYATDAVNAISVNLSLKINNGDRTIEIEDKEIGSLENTLQEFEDNFYRNIFGKYNFNINDINGSIDELTKLAFGGDRSAMRKEEVTVELFSKALNILTDIKKFEYNIDKMMDSFEEITSSIKADLNTARGNINNIVKTTSNVNFFSLKKDYYSYADRIARTVLNSISRLELMMVTLSNIITRKALILSQIAASMNKIVSKGIMTTDPRTAKQESFSAYDELTSIYNIQDRINKIILLSEEAYLEEQFSGDMYTVLLEEENAEGGNNNSSSSSDNNQNKPAGSSNNEKKSNIVKDTGAKILNWLRGMMEKISKMIDKFKLRIQELITKIDGPWWKKHKEEIQKMKFTDTTVNQWYQYNIDAMKNSTYIKFDFHRLDELLNQDTVREMIMKKISTNLPQFKDDDSFSTKIAKIYQGEYINVEGNGKTLSEIHFDEAKVFTFVNEFVEKGFKSDILGKVNEDYNQMLKDEKTVVNEFSNIMDYLNKANKKMEKLEKMGKENVNASYSFINNNDRFDLAEHFGLMVNHEADITPGKQDQESSGFGMSLSEIDEKGTQLIKVFFTNNITAVTTKMTSALAAYKQYTALYKSIFKKKKDDEEPKENNDQNKNENQNDDQKKDEK